ncbi:hypoxanthine phosphoribosyltransferase [Lewinellaceae bacterium SD302]|nr:hypoxanthine phosphoribosyltransferase [Lewinellaceae bacterium SD302]
MDSDKNLPDELIQLHQLRFHTYINSEDIQKRVQEIGGELREKLAGTRPVFLVMLKGAFVFAADLIRAAELDAEVDFVRTSSYVGTVSSREIKLLLPPDPELVRDRHVVLVEDIVDSGYTMQHFLPKLHELEPASVTLVTLLHKPEASKVPVKIDHVGFSIPNKFIVGYGMDYDGLGRQLAGIYQVI